MAFECDQFHHTLSGGRPTRQAITRDIEWGIPVPLKATNKRDSMSGLKLLSATFQRPKNGQNQPVMKRSGVISGRKTAAAIISSVKIILLPYDHLASDADGYGGLNLPFDVPANEFLSIEGKKVSTSRNWAVWMPDYLDKYAPDPLRYLLSANMPETNDMDFSGANTCGATTTN